jgi:hypothetical protein
MCYLPEAVKREIQETHLHEEVGHHIQIERTVFYENPTDRNS